MKATSSEQPKIMKIRPNIIFDFFVLTKPCVAITPPLVRAIIHKLPLKEKQRKRDRDSREILKRLLEKVQLCPVALILSCIARAIEKRKQEYWPLSTILGSREIRK